MFAVGTTDPGAAFAALIGPIVAVGITLWLQNRDRSRDRKETLLRQLIATRLNPSDQAYNLVISLTPIEFRKHRNVVIAHKDYIAASNRPQPANTQAALEALLLEMMRVLGFNVEAAKDVIREPYSSVGLGNALKLQNDALQALPRLADALERTALSSESTHMLLARAADSASAPAKE